jgi:hypothetical protein
MCGFHHKNQSGLELKIVLAIENGEEPALSFGVNIIWVDNHKDEIPTILQKIRDS